MDSTNLLTLPRLLTIVSTADDLTNHPSLFSKSAPNIKRARKVYHSMLLLSILEGYATHGPFPAYPDHFCFKIHYTKQLSKDISAYDTDFKNKTQEDNKPSHYILHKFEKIFYFGDEEEEEEDEDEDEDEDDNDDEHESKPRKKKAKEMPLPKDWTCSTDLFFDYYKEYIRLLTSTKWFQKHNKLLAPFLKHLSRSTKLSSGDLELPGFVKIQIKKVNSKIIPFSFNEVMNALFQPFPDEVKDDIFEDASLWRIDDMAKLNQYFGYEKASDNTAEEQEPDTVIPYTRSKDLSQFKEMCLRECELPNTKQNRKKEIAKHYFILDQSSVKNGFEWCNATHFLKHLQDPEYKAKINYTKCKDFPTFQMMAYIHYNLPTTSQGKQASIATAYMAIDIATNIRNIPFHQANSILTQLMEDKPTTFDIYGEQDVE